MANKYDTLSVPIAMYFFVSPAFHAALATEGLRSELVLIRTISNLIKSFDERGHSLGVRRRWRYLALYMLRRLCGSSIPFAAPTWPSHIYGIPMQLMLGLITTIELAVQCAEGEDGAGLIVMDRLYSQDDVERRHSTMVQAWGSKMRADQVMEQAYKLEFLWELQETGERELGFPLRQRESQYMQYRTEEAGGGGALERIAAWATSPEGAAQARLAEIERRARKATSWGGADERAREKAKKSVTTKKEMVG